MNKRLFKYAFPFVLIILFSYISNIDVQAENELNNIYIEVELHEDGRGEVTEHRQMNMDEGTELYIDLSNLQDSELLDFSVSGYEEVENWDSDASQEEKAGNYGVIDTEEGKELVWGIGEYGQNTYELTYTLSNLVRELEDGQAMLWNFDTFSDIPAENLTLDITGHEPFTEENTRLWGFGFEGDIQLRNGNVVWEAYEEVDNNNDVTALLQFPEGFFDTQVSVDMTLEEQLDMAQDASAYNDDSSSSIIILIIAAVLAIIGIGAGAVVTAVYFSKVRKEKEAAGDLNIKSQVRENAGIYSDRIPYEGEDLADIAYLLNEIQAGYFEDYFSANLLQWVDQGKIEIQASGNKSIFGDTFETEIEIFNYEEEREKHPSTFAQFMKDHELDSSNKTYEKGLWVMLLDAADPDGFVDDNEIQKWAKKNAKPVEKYADFLPEYSKKVLEEEKLISFDKITVWNTDHEILIPSEEGVKLFDRIIQFDNYLEATDLAEIIRQESSELSFEEALIWNVLYGRSSETTEQIDHMVPENADVRRDYPYWYYVHGIVGFRNNWSNGLSSGGFHSQASGGMGGATSAGGGAGAGGGGGGGAR